MILRNISARQALNAFNWSWKHFSELSTLDLYQIIQARETVFVVEQKLSYVDCDDYDQKAHHLMGYKDGKLVCYLRAFPPGKKVEDVSSFGRVLVMKEERGIGAGKELIMIGLQKMKETYGKVSVRISAQAYLEEFYQDFGFITEGNVYTEEGVPHIKMFLNSI